MRLFAIALAMTGTPLTGDWGGDRSRLTLAADGAVLQQDCAEARFGPVAPDARGRFSARGRFVDHAAGPQPGDRAGDGGRPARFDGHLDGDTLHLTVTPEGGAPQRLTLTAGQGVKLIRCY